MLEQPKLDAFDQTLAQYRPFGDSEYLEGQLEVRYKRRLGTISALLPIAGELSRALDRAEPSRRYRVVGDPVVRHTIQQALRQAVKKTDDVLPLADCEEVFRKTIRHLEAGKSGGPLAAGVPDVKRLGKEPRHGFIWSEEHPDDVFGRTFRKVVHDHFQGEPLCSPRAVDLAMLEKGARLLEALLPLSGRSALSHAHMVAVFPNVGRWTQKGSCSEFRVGSTIFLNQDMLPNPWWVAERLLHESLHQKLYDFRHTHSLLAQDVAPRTSPDPAPTFYSIWNLGGADRPNHWDAFRAIAAFHVYVHVGLFWLRAERRAAGIVKDSDAPEGSFSAAANRQKAFQRAQYLGMKIKGSLWEELGPAGQHLTDWLLSILNDVDPAPPVDDSSYLHLRLDRYVSEASRISRARLSSEQVAQLEKTIAKEAETVRRVASVIDPDRPLDPWGDASTRHEGETPGAAFLRFRREAARILGGLSPDGYGLKGSSRAESTAQDEAVEEMIESSSLELVSLLGA